MRGDKARNGEKAQVAAESRRGAHIFYPEHIIGRGEHGRNFFVRKLACGALHGDGIGNALFEYFPHEFLKSRVGGRGELRRGGDER